MSSSRSSLTRRRRPKFEHGAEPVRIVDLFAGCGGLTLGVAQAALAVGRALDVRLAVDLEPAATAVYKANFPRAARVESSAVQDFFDGDLGDPATLRERQTHLSVGDVDVLVGGPPCQGHSNLNNHTRRVDEKNGLYLRMARAVEILRPRIVVIENVPSVLRDRHDGEGVVQRTERHLRELGYRTSQQVVSLTRLGVAQSRRRHLLVATARDEASPEAIIARATRQQVERDLRWAIGDLVDTSEAGLFDQRPVPTSENLARMRFLLDSGKYDLPNELRPRCQQDAHKYASMYGRLNWDLPAQTLTSGYGSIGQGRYMHPDQPRALTAHEAARIQGFPDYFDFSACTTRSKLATMIGNAVPPQLGHELTAAFLALSEHVRADDAVIASETA